MATQQKLKIGIPPPQSTAKIKSLLLRAWRERWTDIQFSIALKKALPSEAAGETIGLAELILQQALIGSSPNLLVLSYLKHALASQVVSYTSCLQSIMRLCDLSRPYCLKSCLDFMEAFIGKISSLAIEEDSMELVAMLHQLLHWLYKVVDGAAGADGQRTAENQAVLEKALDVLAALISSRPNQGLLYLARKDDTDLAAKVEQQEAGLKSTAHILPSACKSKLSKVLDASISVGFPERPTECLCNPEDHPLNYTVNTIVTLEAMLNLCNDVENFAKQLLIIQKMQGITRASLYCEILRASFMGVIDAAQGMDELKWVAFAFLKIPFLLSRLVLLGHLEGTGGEESLAELQHGIQKFLSYVPLLNLADTKYNIDCLNCLLTHLCSKYSLIDENQFQQYIAVRNAAGDRPKLVDLPPTQQIPSLVLRAEPTVNSILKTLDADYSKNQEALLKVLCHMLTGKSFELILAASAATGKLQSLAVKLIKFNEFSKHGTGETGKGAQIRACLFDVTFLMLCHIAQLYGTEVVTGHKDSQSSFFCQWASLCLPEGGQYKSIEAFPSPDNTKVEALLEQLKPGNELRTSMTRWQDVCFNTPFATQELLYAWEHGCVNNDLVKVMLDNMKSKVCCLAVVSVAFLCSYANVAGEDARKKPNIMIHQLGTTPQLDPQNPDFIAERSHLMSQLIKKMVQDMLPAKKRMSKDHIIPPTMPSSTFLHETYTDSFSRGYVNTAGLNKFVGLVSVTGTQWFCDNLVKEMLSHTREEEFSKSLCLVFALFNIDLEALTTALLHRTVPSLLQGSVNKLSMLTDPKGRTLAKLCVMCLTAINSMKEVKDQNLGRGLKRPRIEVEIDDSDCDSDDLRPIKQLKLGEAAATAIQPDTFPMDFSSPERDQQSRMQTSAGPQVNTVNRAIVRLLQLFAHILSGDKVSQSTSFILSFLQECVQMGEQNSRAVLRYMPKTLLSLLMKTLPHTFTTDFILAVCDGSTVAGRKLASKAICQNSRFTATRRI